MEVGYDLLGSLALLSLQLTGSSLSCFHWESGAINLFDDCVLIAFLASLLFFSLLICPRRWGINKKYCQ